MTLDELGWNDFNVGILGATAALAGLVIVAASVNIAEIVKSRSLTSRLGAGIATLVLAITSSALALFPAMTFVVYGIAVLAAALLAMVFNAHAARAIARNANPQNRWKALRAAVNFLPATIYAVGAVLLIADRPAGLVVVALGAIIAIPVALMISWIVLVEVLR